MRPSTATASRAELDAYGSILSHLKVLAQGLQPTDLSESQVTEAIRAHLLRMLDSLEASPGDSQAGRA